MNVQWVTTTFENDYNHHSCTIKWNEKEIYINDYPVTEMSSIPGHIFILETKQAVHFFYPTKIFEMFYLQRFKGGDEVVFSVPILHILLGIKGYNGRNLKKEYL